MRWLLAASLLSCVALSGCADYAREPVKKVDKVETTTETSKTMVIEPTERWVVNKASHQRGMIVAHSQWDTANIKVRLIDGTEANWWGGEYTEEPVVTTRPVAVADAQ